MESGCKDFVPYLVFASKYALLRPPQLSLTSQVFLFIVAVLRKRRIVSEFDARIPVADVLTYTSLFGRHRLSIKSEVRVVHKVKSQVARLGRVPRCFLWQGEEHPWSSIGGPVLGIVDLSTQDARACYDVRIV